MNTASEVWSLGPVVEKPKPDFEWPSTAYDAESGLHIGPPSLREDGIAGVPSEPHVFQSSRLSITSGDAATQHDDINVLVAHGYIRDGQWVFENGRGVVQTVTEFNEAADEQQKIKFLAVCNPTEGTGIDDQLKMLSEQEVGFAVGSKVGVTIFPNTDVGGIETDITLLDQNGTIVG